MLWTETNFLLFHLRIILVFGLRLVLFLIFFVLSILDI